VLGDKQRVEAALFDRTGHGSRRDPFIGHERRDAKLHTFIEPYPEANEVCFNPSMGYSWVDHRVCGPLLPIGPCVFRRLYALDKPFFSL
jgi:hypothetical protein